MPHPGVRVEKPVNQFQQLVDSGIGDAVFDRRKQAELAAEAEDIPRIDDRPAFDPPVQKILDLGQQLDAVGQAALIGGAVRGRDQAMDLANHPRGHGRHDFHLP